MNCSDPSYKCAYPACPLSALLALTNAEIYPERVQRFFHVKAHSFSYGSLSNAREFLYYLDAVCWHYAWQNRDVYACCLAAPNEVEEILVIVEIVGYDVFHPLVCLLAGYPAYFHISVNLICLLL